MSVSLKLLINMVNENELINHIILIACELSTSINKSLLYRDDSKARNEEAHI